VEARAVPGDGAGEFHADVCACLELSAPRHPVCKPSLAVWDGAELPQTRHLPVPIGPGCAMFSMVLARGAAS